MPKEVSNWYLALIFSLASIIIAGVLLASLAVLVLAFEQFIPRLILVVALFGILLVLWLSTKYAAKFVEKRYVVANKQVVLNLSLTYFLIMAAAVVFLFLLRLKYFPMDMIAFLSVIVVVLYLGEWRYLEESEQEMKF